MSDIDILTQIERALVSDSQTQRDLAMDGAHVEIQRLRKENAILDKELVRHIRPSELISQVERMSWQPIETAPKDGSFVHLWFPTNGSALSDLCLTCRWVPDGWWVAQSGGRGFRMDGPSHWKTITSPTFTSDERA